MIGVIEGLRDDSWISYEPVEGVVNSNDQIDIALCCDFTDLDSGIYESHLTFHSNDPVNDSVIVFVEIDVQLYDVVDPAASVMPVEFGIVSAYPNPFNSVLQISYSLEAAGDVRLGVYDLAGRHVAELVKGYFNPGMYAAELNGIDLSSGVYLLRLESGIDVSLLKIVLVR
ncbi:hypothetical protein ES708_17393 [subsurface metagenome]